MGTTRDSKYRSVSRYLVLALAGVVFASAGSTLGLGESSTRSVLRVGTSGTYPPFTFIDEGKPSGAEVDFAEALAAALGLELKISVIPFPDLIGEISAGRIDIIMAGMSVTPRRSELVSFATPYLQVGQMAVVRSADVLRFLSTDAYDQDGVRIGFERATTGAKYVLGTMQKARPVEFASKEDALEGLRTSKVDVVVHDAPFVWLTTGSPLEPNPDFSGRYTPLTDEYLAWAVRKGDTELLEQVNDIVQRWQDEGGIEAVLDLWIKTRKITRPVE
jgi:ABC-type amino acid transport substrate-binding protein